MSQYRYLSALLAVQLMFAALADGQQPPAEPARMAPAQVVGGIKVLILEGQHAFNNTTRHIGIQPIVEVRDENDRPVEGATVVFRLPLNGPGGSFAGQKPALTVKTNVQGQAAVTGFVPNDLPGQFTIHVTANVGNRIGEAVITETNSATQLSLNAPKPPHRPFWRNKYFLIAVGGAAVAGITIALTRGSSSSKNPTVTINPGPVTINQ